MFIIFLALDQISKISIRHLFSHAHSDTLPILGNFFRLTFVENQGAVFGINPQLGQLTNIILLVLHIVAIVIIIFLFRRNTHPLARFSFTLILSGAFGNLIDRIFLGKVTDFLDVEFFNITIGKWHIDRWYVFNIADSCIVVGVILLIIYYLFVENSAKQEEILEKE
ncbi:MAG: signal peptidase II [Candidatus Cloacimonetes bacterium]|nr:signal peptidase II [Candidatus Cloacimonadota bacterium]